MLMQNLTRALHAFFTVDLCTEASAVQGESHLQAASRVQDTELLYYIIARSKHVKMHKESKAAEVAGASNCDCIALR